MSAALLNHPPPLSLRSSQYQRKNKSNKRGHDLDKSKGNIPPAAHGDAKWRGVRLPWQGISGRRGGGAMLQGWFGWGAERAHMVYVRLSPCSIVIPAKSRNGNSEQGCEGNVYS